MFSEQAIVSFVRLDEGESFDREYYIAHTSKSRFTAGTILLILFGLCLFIVPGIILILYFAFRSLKVSHGYACTTNKRVIYYEFNQHPEENYHSLHSLHIADLSSLQFYIERTIISKSFQMTLWTSKKGLKVGAKGLLGIFRMFSKRVQMEPGPDALEFIQVMSGEIAARKIASMP